MFLHVEKLLRLDRPYLALEVVVLFVVVDHGCDRCSLAGCFGNPVVWDGDGLVLLVWWQTECVEYDGVLDDVILHACVRDPSCVPCWLWHEALVNSYAVWFALWCL